MKYGCTLANVSNMNLNTASGCSANTQLIDRLHVQTTAEIIMLFQVDFFFLPLSLFETLEIENYLKSLL